MTRTRSIGWAVFAAFGLLSLSGCSDSSSGPKGTTSLSVMLKDAPANLASAVVTVAEVDLVGSDGIHVLTSTPATVDLLRLKDTATTLVKDAVVATGTYSELRFKITGGYVEVDNGDGTTSIYASSPGYAGLPQGATVAGKLQMPSFAQSGLKVTLTSDALVLSSPQKVLVVDFDVSQSFGHVAGQSGMWVMHPVVTGGDIQSSGGAEVSVQLAQGVTLPVVNNLQVTLGDFSAVLTNTADASTISVPLTESSTPGVFVANFGFLSAGSYSLDLQLPTGVSSVTTTPALPQAVTVTAGGSVSIALTVTAAS